MFVFLGRRRGQQRHFQEGPEVDERTQLWAALTIAAHCIEADTAAP